MARLKPCPSCRDAFSLSMFGACAPDEPEKSPGAKEFALELPIVFVPVRQNPTRHFRAGLQIVPRLGTDCVG
jgi:hypothetical protein